MPANGLGGLLRDVPMIQFLYRVKRGVLRVSGLRTRGVKVLVANGAGEVLLIRNSYGNTDHFVLPGGGMRPWEAADAAAVREVREEVAITLTEVRLVSEHASRAEGKRDTIFLFHAISDDAPRSDSIEVLEAAYFAPGALPDSVSPATRRRIEEWQGRREADGSW